MVLRGRPGHGYEAGPLAVAGPRNFLTMGHRGSPSLCLTPSKECGLDSSRGFSGGQIKDSGQCTLAAVEPSGSWPSCVLQVLLTLSGSGGNAQRTEWAGWKATPAKPR